MSDSMILAVGVFAFVMTLAGVAFTVIEFRRTVFLKQLPAPLDHTIERGRGAARAHTSHGGEHTSAYA